MSRIKTNVWWIITFVVIISIFYATQSPGFTGSHTKGLLYSFLSSFFDPNPSVIWTINVIIRKTGHIVAFGILAVFLYLALSKTRRPFLYAWVITTVYAVVDEFHQGFIPGRTSSFADVVLDSFGAFLALMIIKKIRKNSM